MRLHTDAQSTTGSRCKSTGAISSQSEPSSSGRRRPADERKIVKNISAGSEPSARSRLSPESHQQKPTQEISAVDLLTAPSVALMTPVDASPFRSCVGSMRAEESRERRQCG